MRWDQVGSARFSTLHKSCRAGQHLQHLNLQVCAAVICLLAGFMGICVGSLTAGPSPCMSPLRLCFVPEHARAAEVAGPLPPVLQRLLQLRALQQFALEQQVAGSGGRGQHIQPLVLQRVEGTIEELGAWEGTAASPEAQRLLHSALLAVRSEVRMGTPLCFMMWASCTCMRPVHACPLGWCFCPLNLHELHVTLCPQTCMCICTCPCADLCPCAAGCRPCGQQRCMAGVLPVCPCTLPSRRCRPFLCNGSRQLS